MIEKFGKKGRMFLIFEGRFPSEKAASIFAAKSCEAFTKLGYEVVLLVPRRLQRSKENYGPFYNIQAKFSVVFLPVVDLVDVPFVSRIAFRLSLLTFSLSVFFYILINKKTEDGGDIAYSNALLPLFVVSLAGVPGLYEVHDFPEKHLGFYKLLVNRIKWILSTNAWKKDELKKIFGIDTKKILVEPNAVELESFGAEIQKADARAQLSLPTDKDIVLYTGHLYDWKGVHVLAKAAKQLPEHFSVYFVGGTAYDVSIFSKEYGEVPSIKIIGHRPYAEIPIWQAAADILVLPNTAKEKISAYYTSPMKLFEYMASGRPIVASDLPSIRQITGSDAAVMFEPDNSDSLAEKIVEVFENKELGYKVAMAAGEKVKEHTWDKRAARIATFLNG